MKIWHKFSLPLITNCSKISHCMQWQCREKEGQQKVALFATKIFPFYRFRLLIKFHSPMAKNSFYWYSAMSNFHMGTILGKGFAQAQVHMSIARVPKARVLLTLCTSAWAKPFPKIVPMMKLHSLLVATCWISDFVFLKEFQNSIPSTMMQSFCAKLFATFATSGKKLGTIYFIYHGAKLLCKAFCH